MNPRLIADEPGARERSVANAGGPVQTSNSTVPAETSPVTKSPADCTSKEDVRAEIDRIDQSLLSLLAERHAYVTRMAEIKTDPHEAYDPTRIEAIIAKQRKRALELDLDEDQAELIWRTLINWNVNYEKGIIAARKRHG
jgi:isochorismate pyruvate lyase